MNKGTINTIIGVLLIFGILVGYSILTAPSKEEIEKKRKEDSIFLAREKQRLEDSVEAELLKVDEKKEDSLNATKNVPASKTTAADSIKTSSAVLNEMFASSYIGSNKHVVIETDLLKLKFASRGGGISYVELKKYKTWDKKPLVLFNTDTSNYNITFPSRYKGKDIHTGQMFFQPYWQDKKWEGNDSIVISGKDSVIFSFRLYPNVSGDTLLSLDKYIEFQYIVRGNDYMLGYHVNIENMKESLDVNSSDLPFDWSLHLSQQEKSHKNEAINSTVYFKPTQDDVDYLSETSNDKKEEKIYLKWVSFKQQFFTSTIIADNNFSCTRIETFQNTDTLFPGYLKSMSASLTFAYQAADKVSYPMKMYFGPNHYKTLRSYKLDLERQIPLGWSSPYILGWINRWLVIPVFNWLSQTGMNYGIIILILTIFIKILLLPIAYKTYMSSARMRVLKPEVDEIGKKFPKREDAMKKQQATMALYKKAGINPMAGCIPLLLQMPILIALFRFFPASIELRQQSFLWASDLSTYDSIWTFGYVPIINYIYGEHVSLFTLLMTISTIIYTKLNNQMMGAANNQPGMKFVMYAMPIMFLGFFNNFAAGLSYYYLLTNLITFLQMYLFRKFVNEEKIHAKIQENKKKPVKVSGFQKRLEEMAKKRGYPVKK